ncbi:MAG: uroporphyrinogen decarboxylase family protein [Coprothermobacterota bacterium]|nr:uroporphyrinogen decarboxylase family protein [Coprothermobacterota bacterium]
MSSAMTPLQRVLTALGHQEADRVPFFLFLSLHGARELGMPLRQYFSRGENVAEAQLRMQNRYGHDCLDGFFYAPAEIEAWGGEVVWFEDGPPNSATPFLSDVRAIAGLKPPRVEETPVLVEALKAISLMKEQSSLIPILGVAISPFSLPVMQMGFEAYLQLILEQPEAFWQLMRVNEEWCVSWANAQLSAGATAIAYFDPVSSPTVIPPDLYRKTGFLVACRTLPRILGPTVTHLASGRALPILDDLAATGTAGVGVSALEDLAELKRVASGKLALLGNLNGIQMRHWTAADAEREVKQAIAKAGKGGGFILADNHGEIPWQVSEGTLSAIADTVRRWGHYPLDWIDESLT